MSHRPHHRTRSRRLSGFAAALGFAIVCTALVSAPRASSAGGTPKSEYGARGYDSDGGDHATRPGDDFFRYANGAWIDRLEIPADRQGYSLRAAMSDTVEKRLHEMLEKSAATAGHEPRTLEGKVGAFYRSFTDESRVESLGARPLDPAFAAIRAAGTREALAALMGRNVEDFEGSLFGILLDADIKAPTRYAIYLRQAGLTLPDRDYYLEPSFAEKKAAYQAYVGDLLGRIEWPEPAARAADIVAFESDVAAASWTRVQQRDPVALYNAETLAGLDSLAPGFAWRPFLAAARLGDVRRVVVGEKSAFPAIAAIYAKTPVPVLQAWLAFTAADNAAPYLSSPFANAYFEFHNKALGGQKTQAARWKRAVHAVSGGDFGTGERGDYFGNMGFGLGQLYTERYFPPAAKARIESLVLNLKAAYHARIERLDWMSPATRKRALEKLDTYQIKVGYPDRARDYSKLVIRDDDLAGNVRRAAEADWAFYAGRLAQPVDRLDWGMTLQTNDAYNGSLRDIVFPAGILQPPIFDANADAAMNYGAAGGVIGHELTHGFDDEGRKLDAKGALRDWWEASDADAFQARAKKLGAQYSAFEPLPGVKVNGDLTMGENIADLGGVTLALEAYHASLHGKPAPVLDGLTGDQRVFLGWAQAWRGKRRDEALKRLVTSDPHSPAMYRVNGVVRNIDAWYEAFGVKPGDSLYVAPADRVRIW